MASGGPCLIGGDFNAHHTAWGDIRCDVPGNHLLNLLINSHLDLQNDPEQGPTYSQPNGTSYIDLTLTRNLAISNWTLSELIVSDHRTITAQLDYPGNSSIQPNPTKKFKFTPKISGKFSIQMSVFFSPDLIASIANSQAADDWASDFSAAVHNFIDVNSTVPQPRKTQPHWWTDECKEAQQNARRALRCFRKNKNSPQSRELYSKYQAFHKRFNKICSRAKRLSWRRFISESSGKNPFTNAYKFCFGKFKSRNPVLSIQTADFTFTEPDDIAKALLAEHFPTTIDVGPEKPPTLVTQANDIEFSMGEVDACIRKLRRDVAAGPDKVSVPMLRQLWADHSTGMLSLFNKLLSIGHFPAAWKQAFVAFIPKPGRTTTTPKTTDFRPISLLSIFGKVLDALLANRLSFSALECGFIAETQFGFTEGRSADDALLNITDFINTQLSKKYHVFALSLDIIGAFSNANWRIIKSILDLMPIGHQLRTLAYSFCSNRSAASRDFPAVSRELSMGCPQGSCCGPILWNILFNSFLSSLSSFDATTYPIHTQAYADDGITLVAIKDPREFGLIGQRVLDLLHGWAATNQLQFSPVKTTWTIFTRDTSLRSVMRNPTQRNLRWQPLQLGNSAVQYANTFRLLGVVFDDGLTWRYHISYITKRVNTLFAAALRSTRIRWGFSPQALMTMYKAILEPILTYGSVIWAERVSKVKYLYNKLRSTQRTVLLSVTGCYRTTSHEKVQRIAKTPPIDITAKQFAIHRKLQLTATDIDKTPKGIAAGHPSGRISIHYKHFKDHFSPAVLNCFTDGSKTDNYVGAAFITVPVDGSTITHTHKTQLAAHCSIFQAELLAISNALEHTLALQPPPPSVAVITDSLSSLKALQNPRPVHNLIIKIKSTYAALTKCGTTVSFFWCRAHIGTAGNEAADKAAKTAHTEPITYFNRPATVFKQLKYQAIRDAWADEPSTITNGIILDVWPTTASRIKSRYQPVHKYIHHFLSDHGPFRARIARFMTDVTCQCGTGEHNAIHVLNNCPLAAQARSTIVKAFGGISRTIVASEIVSFIVGHSPKSQPRLNQLLRRMEELSPACTLNADYQPP